MTVALSEARASFLARQFRKPGAFKTVSDDPLSMGPFREACSLSCDPQDLSDTGYLARSAQRTWARYASNKAELENAFDDYAQRLSAPPLIVGFRHMVETAKNISDPLVKALLVNSWVNTAIAYDEEEAKVSERRSMLEALRMGKGVCVEFAELKIAALELAGFPAEDIDYIDEILVKDGKYGEKHAIAAVRVGGKTWIMDAYFALLGDHDRITQPEVQQAVRIINSKMKDAATHMHLDKDSATPTFYPYKACDSSGAAIFDRNAALWADYEEGADFRLQDIETAENATPRTIALKKCDVGDTPDYRAATACVKTAIALRYGVAPA